MVSLRDCSRAYDITSTMSKSVIQNTLILSGWNPKPLQQTSQTGDSSYDQKSQSYKDPASHSTCKESKTKSCACEGVPDPLIGHNKPRNNPLHHLSGMSLPWPLHGVFARQNEYEGLQWGHASGFDPSSSVYSTLVIYQPKEVDIACHEAYNLYR